MDPILNVYIFKPLKYRQSRDYKDHIGIFFIFYYSLVHNFLPNEMVFYHIYLSKEGGLLTRFKPNDQIQFNKTSQKLKQICIFTFTIIYKKKIRCTKNRLTKQIQKSATIVNGNDTT